MMLKKALQILLTLIPVFGFSQANSQYPDSNNKIRLGFQTSGDGLIWRDTQPKVGGYQPINNKAAWIILDTVNNKFYHYKNSTWTLAGGQDIDTTNLIATKYNLGFKLNIGDTATMLTPYWRSGRFSGILPVANGGTGATVKIFVDTFSNQTVNGLKTFKDSLFLGNAIIGKTKQNNNSIRFGINAGLSTGDKNIAIGTNNLQNDTGGENVAIGFEAGKNLTIGTRNMLLGSSSGAALTTGSSNVAFGATALLNCTDCIGNTAIGRESMEQTLTGASNNTFVGYSSGYSNTTGDNNSSLGFLSGYGVNGALANTTGSNNIFIGYQSVGESATESNRTWIGNTSTTSTWVGGNLLVGTRTNGNAKLQVKSSGVATGEAFKIENSGNTNLLTVLDNGAATFSSSVTANSLSLTTPLSVANGGTGITSLGTGVATFLGTPSSANLASAMTDETGSGNLVFSTQPVFTNTIGIGGATASTSGSGITFPASLSASTNANTLDDYEEGTWTPVYAGLGGSIGSTAYSIQRGRYTKIGRFVHASGEITLTNKGSWSSGVVIFGLPFNTTSTEAAFGFIILNYVDLDAGVKYCQFRGTGAANDQGYIDTILDNAERIILYTTAINNNSGFEFSFIYTAN